MRKKLLSIALSVIIGVSAGVWVGANSWVQPIVNRAITLETNMPEPDFARDLVLEECAANGGCNAILYIGAVEETDEYYGVAVFIVTWTNPESGLTSQIVRKVQLEGGVPIGVN